MNDLSTKSLAQAQANEANPQAQVGSLALSLSKLNLAGTVSPDLSSAFNKV
jgi:hypothetical protein